jgi:carboxymethylenebutenolidase
MTEDRIVIDTPEGPMEAHRAAPPDGERSAAVIVIHEAYGVDEHVRSICRRFAREGYVAVAPELYHREGNGIAAGYDHFDEARAHLARLTNDGIESDLRSALAAMRSDPSVRADRVGVVGFCAGGFAALCAACRTDVAATVVFYGGGIVRERPGSGLKPLLPEVERIDAPVLAFFGERDASIPPTDVEAIGNRLRALGKTFEIVTYPEAGHAFFNDARDSYRAAAAVDAWRRTLDWFERYLPVE